MKTTKLFFAFVLLLVLAFPLVGFGGCGDQTGPAESDAILETGPTPAAGATVRAPAQPAQTAVPTGAPTLAPTTAIATAVPTVINPTAVPQVPTYATWGPSFVGNRNAPVNSISIVVQAPGKYIAFTMDALDIANTGANASIGGVNLTCQKVANPSEQLPTYVCKKADGSAISGTVTIKGNKFFQVWPQSSAPVPAGWAVSSVPVQVANLKGGAVALNVPKVVAAPLSRNLDSRLNAMGVGVNNDPKALWRVTYVRFEDVKDDHMFGGDHNIYVRTFDVNGKQIEGVPVTVKWADGADPLVTNLSKTTAANAIMSNDGHGCSYSAFVNQGTSEVVSCLGMGSYESRTKGKPYADHVSYVVDFQKTR